MAFHIVTDRCFLACEKVTSVVIEEIITDKPAAKPLRKKTAKSLKKFNAKYLKKVKEVPRQYSITIAYYPIAVSATKTNYNNNSGPEEYSIELRVFGKKEAHMLYAEIIKEVQEQHPGEGYLDKLVTKMLSGDLFKVEEPELKDATN